MQIRGRDQFGADSLNYKSRRMKIEAISEHKIDFIFSSISQADFYFDIILLRGSDDKDV